MVASELANHMKTDISDGESHVFVPQLDNALHEYRRDAQGFSPGRNGAERNS